MTATEAQIEAVPPLTFTPAAIERVKTLLARPESQGKVLRILVYGGGCAGLEYGMALGFVKLDDHVIEFESGKVVVDPRSMEFLKGMKVDYYESVQSSGFKFNNPNAAVSCGCGISFKPAQKTEMAKPQPCH